MSNQTPDERRPAAAITITYDNAPQTASSQNFCSEQACSPRGGARPALLGFSSCRRQRSVLLVGVEAFPGMTLSVRVPGTFPRAPCRVGRTNLFPQHDTTPVALPGSYAARRLQRRKRFGGTKNPTQRIWRAALICTSVALQKPLSHSQPITQVMTQYQLVFAEASNRSIVHLAYAPPPNLSSS